MLKADKYCIQPNKEQQKLLQNNFDAARYVYNRSLALKSYIYKLNSFTIGLKELKSRLSKLLNCYSCLTEGYNAVLQ